MAKVVFIGAGSFKFTRKLVRDLLTFPALESAEIALVDINRERLNFARRACEKIIALGNYPATVTATTERRDVLKDADAVCITIFCGGTAVWQHDVLIPEKYGISINIGDTRGPSGIFRMLRTLPTMLAICRDMEDLCPGAILLNYTNPMAMLCHAMQQESGILSTGLCHSVQGTAAMLARWLRIPPAGLDYVCAGINHMAWYTKLEHRGRDQYPRLKRLVASDETIYEEEIVRNEMFLALGSYVTESSGHNSEYNWWFRKRPDLMSQYCNRGNGSNPGRHLHALKAYRRHEKTWKREVRDWLDSDEPIELERGNEYAASIINAYLGDGLFKFNGNVTNTGLVDNLPEGACVEVPVLAGPRRLEPIPVGPIPNACAILTCLTAQTEMMAVEGCLSGDRDLIYQAIAHDPLTASKLSLAETRTMVDEMFRRNKRFLPQFKI